MFEARLVQGATLKKILDSVKDLVNEANFDCTKDGFSMQAMDSSHVALIALKLEDKAFDEDSYRCDRSMTLGMNLQSVSKMLKCANNDDIITMKAEDNPDLINFMFESKDGDRVSDFELKLMQIDSETLGIPDSDYDARIKMPSNEFKRIASDLSSIGDTITVSVTKDGIKFSTLGDIGNANVLVKQTSSVDDKSKETIIDMKEPVSLGFAARYFNSFAKATPLSDEVTLSIHKELPLLVEYPVKKEEDDSQVGYVRYYLAPKIDDEDNED